MHKILAYGTLALLFAVPVAVQAQADELSQAMVRPGVLAPGVDGITARGEIVPAGDAEAQNSSGDANIGMHIWVMPQSRSGGSGMEQTARPSARYPIDPNSPYDNYSVFAR
jgi:hypothetical protein